MRANLAIQCDASTGETGTFLFVYDMVPVSPVLPSCVELFAWAKQAGWTADPYDPAHPVGTYSGPFTCSPASIRAEHDAEVSLLEEQGFARADRQVAP